MLTLHLSDKSSPVELEADGRSLLDLIIEQDKPRLKEVVAARVGEEILDLKSVPADGDEIFLVEKDSDAGLEVLRHSAAHVMAEAVQELFPKAKVTIGPAIKDGFYYDFDIESPFTPEDLRAIEKQMKANIKKGRRFVRREVERQEAIDLFTGMGEKYKVELIEDLPEDEKLSLYQSGEFVDLCRGPHLPNASYLKGSFKLLSVAGAYWRGSEKNQMLQRIYGTAFADKEALTAHLTRLEEAKKRDHRKLGKELDLFSIQDEAGAGFVIWHPKGALLRTILEDFERRQHLKRGYDIVMGPQMLKAELWKRSGHFEHYRENMYFTRIKDDDGAGEGQEYGIKPMNCLAHMLIYNSRLRSYRDLPLRYFELGTVHRHEPSGVLHGLMRVRCFTQDDAHIICTPEQLQDEITRILEFVADIMQVFGFSYSMELSTRPEEKSIGSDRDWERATAALIQALEENHLDYEVNAGDGAFYGPKIDVKLKDALGREWQCATIQCDFTLPERFDLNYIGADGEKHRPVMLHRVILGSIERFIGILIEHYAGAFPLWLAPEQVRVLTVTEAHNDYAERVAAVLKVADIRVATDLRNEKLGKKIRESQLDKIPYMLVIGDQEVASETVAPRLRKQGETLASMSVDHFICHLQDELQDTVGGSHSC